MKEAGMGFLLSVGYRWKAKDGPFSGSLSVD